MVAGVKHVFDQEFLIRVQKGYVPGHSIISKFAENPSIVSGVNATIWDYPDEAEYAFSTTAAIDSMSSDNAGDTLEILVQGLDANYNDVVQVLALTGQTRVPLPTPLLRIYRAFNANGTDLLGNVYIYENTAISGGKPTDTTKTRAYIAKDEQQTLLGVYTVPNAVTGYFLGLSTSMSRIPSAANLIFTGKARGFGGVFRTQIRFNLSSTGTSARDILPTASTKFPAKTDFISMAQPSTNSIGASVTFDLLLVEDGF